MRSELLETIHGEVVGVRVDARRGRPLAGPHLLLEPVDELRGLRELPMHLVPPPPHLLQLRRDRAQLLHEAPGAGPGSSPRVIADGGAEGGQLGEGSGDLCPQARALLPHLRDLGPVDGEAVLLERPQRLPPVLLRLADLVPRLPELPQQQLAPGLHSLFWNVRGTG